MDAVTATLALQRAAGNRATTQAVARLKKAPKTPQQAGHDLVVKHRWNSAIAALSLMSQADEQAVLSTLDEDQLRTLHFRTGAGGKDTRVMQDIRAEYQSRNVTITHGQGISGDGQVMVQVGPIKHGQPGAADPDDEQFSYPVTVSYLPPPDLKGVEQVAWIQTVRVVEPTTGTNKSPYGAKRMLADFTKVDRLGGKKQGWYGMEDSGAAQDNLHKWNKGEKDPAWLFDAPGASDGPRSYTFVSAAVVRKGKEKGKVLATVEWSFDVDANLQVTTKATTITNNLTQDFTDAVGEWNKQAKLKNKADRNAPNQLTLPTLK